MGNTLFSQHIFLFPFKWEAWLGSNHDKRSLTDRTSLDRVEEALNLKYWAKFSFRPKVHGSVNTYNEYSYFYAHARDVLSLEPENDYVNTLQFEYKGLQDGASYTIDAKGKSYTLKLDEILLNLYENGIGVLSFHLKNFDSGDFEDILKINDFGRRIYPQYLQAEEPFTKGPKGSFLASSICLKGIDTFIGKEIYEDFTHYDTLNGLNNQLFKLPRHISALLGINFKTRFESLDSNDIVISPVLDDRMFVMSFYYNAEMVQRFAQDYDEAKEVYGHVKSKDWHAYIYVDPSRDATCPSKPMMQQLLAKSSYDRWLPYTYEDPDETKPIGQDGQLYGVTRYSFVLLTTKGWFNTAILPGHFSNQYFQMVLLCLVQRASVLNFSGEVARISQRLTGDTGNLKQEKESIAQLYLKYIKFVNRVYFREVTTQEQGIELYDLLQERMRLKNEVEDLDKEIQELNTFAETQEEGQLTQVASRFLPATFVVGLLGVNIFGDFDIWKNTWFSIITLAGALAAIVFADRLVELVAKINPKNWFK